MQPNVIDLLFHNRRRKHHSWGRCIWIAKINNRMLRLRRIPLPWATSPMYSQGFYMWHSLRLSYRRGRTPLNVWKSSMPRWRFPVFVLPMFKIATAMWQFPAMYGWFRWRRLLIVIACASSSFCRGFGGALIKNKTYHHIWSKRFN